MKIGKDLEVGGIGQKWTRKSRSTSDRRSPKWDSNSFPCEHSLTFLLHHCLAQRMLINRHWIDRVLF